ncbi:MAG: hypothetical protein ABF893_06390 [Gluconacetobacter liquefaciens]
MKDYYVAADVHAVTGLDPRLLKMWVSRKPVMLPIEDDGRKKKARGSPILYTAERVIQIAIAKALIDLGNASRLAIRMAGAALAYCHASDGKDGNLVAAWSTDGSSVHVAPVGPEIPSAVFSVINVGAIAERTMLGLLRL